MAVVGIFQSVEPGCIHSENPVADGTRESGMVERIEVALRAQLLEAFADTFISKR